MVANAAPVFECQDITVRYGAVTALSGVTTAFAAGQIHAVVGQNGAGKTTFARVLAGLLRPASGTLRINGRPLAGGDVRQARDAGVALVHQSFALPPSFTAAEAMQFGANGGAFFTRRKLHRRWQAHFDALDVQVQARERVRDLPIETQQGVEIARALVSDAKLLILDEPTAVLSPEGAEKLFTRIRGLKARGVTVILILHKIRELLAIADTVTVLRGGRLIDGPLPCAEIDAHCLAELIMGAGRAAHGEPASTAPIAPAVSDTARAAPVLTTNQSASLAVDGEVKRGHRSLEPKAHQTCGGEAPTVRSAFFTMRNVSTRDDRDGVALKQVNLDIHAGEIVGVAGVEGNGQATLVRALSALVETSEGRIVQADTDITRTPLAERRAMGLRIIPFERNVEGLSLTSALWENWSARTLLQQPLLSWLRPARVRAQCDAALKTWDVRYHDVAQAAGSLSGGNAQKVILAREMDDDARLIIAAQPTRGLDIGATSFVWEAMRRARARGCGLLLISSDLDEIFDIADRVVVMLSGRIVAEFRPPYDLAAVGAAMTSAAMTGAQS